MTIKVVIVGFALLLLSIACGLAPASSISSFVAVAGRWVGFIIILIGVWLPEK